TKFSCESKNSESCYFAGLLEQASGSLNKSLSFFKQSCVLKNAKGCYYLGKTSLLVDKQTQGIHYLSVSCDLNFSQACLELANHYQEKNLKNDAIIFFVKSCRKTEVNSYERVFNCLMSAQYMSQFFDRKSSLEFFRMACKSDVPKKQNTLDLQNDACTRLALYSNDNSLLGKGIKYSKLRCEKGKSKKDRAYNCYSLACVYSLKNDFNNSLIYLEKAIQEKVFKRKSLEEDFELTNIKNHSEFKELLNSYY
ncbi:MAG: TPR end-of-group domain-containing protein, partial [Bacteriovoracaceae bacterium]